MGVVGRGQQARWQNGNLVMTHFIPLAAAHAFGLINWCVVGLYLAGMITIGHVTARRKMDAHGYFLGQRSVPVFAVVFSTIAAMLSAATFVGAPQRSYNGDLTYLVLNVGG